MKILVALLTLSFMSSAHTPVQPSIDAHFEGKSYHLEQKSRLLIYQSGKYEKAIALQRCNAQVVADFFDRFERYARDYKRHPASEPDAPMIALRTNERETQVAVTSRLGRWLRDMTGEIQRLSARSAHRCKKESAPALHAPPHGP
ncbi:MAG: hypothetical protein HY074_14920 [Deltaproteobacteria bacterium]|nr:hypothetical protein [Deltaproteobacteria bacterium]